jgi:N-acyl amino acid synthase FeeM
MAVPSGSPTCAAERWEVGPEVSISRTLRTESQALRTQAGALRQEAADRRARNRPEHSLPCVGLAAEMSGGSNAVATAEAPSMESQVTTRIRRPKWAEEALVSSLQFTMARESDAFDGAFRLVHDQYVWRDYMGPDESGRRINLRHALPSTRVFVGRDGRQVVGTVSLFKDSVLGLPMDDLYKPELDALRAQGRQLAEASHLATDPHNRILGIAVLMRLFRMMVLYAVRFAEIDDLCLVVSPRHAAFYESYIECEVIGEVKFYETVGVRAVPMRLDLHRVRDFMDDLRSGRACDHEVRSFLYDPTTLSQIAFQLRRDRGRSSFTSDQFLHFFEGSTTLAKATPEQRRFVRSLHRDPAEGLVDHHRSLAAREADDRPAYDDEPMAASMVGR